ncbi:hypothetical protein [Amycolatopsis suaedae]|uniref:Lipoprotein n=1 Tax=Amycolatopsis suaedae TaxID=2510978 RepID=A0A4Q7J637_9PSEU|nr:hypothetical protein [Amycolatopsis suaedae]RZQ62589.1 hypothetical protein EWH70_16585 [Amycolatopsis suaedae]
MSKMQVVAAVLSALALLAVVAAWDVGPAEQALPVAGPELAANDPNAGDPAASQGRIVAAPETEESSPAPAAPGVGRATLVASTAGRAGAVVTDASGRLLYRFDRDVPEGGGPARSTCAGECARVWPPVLTSEQALVEGISPQLVGAVRRPDGGYQVTLAGWPLYRYSGDRVAGEWRGQAVSGTWFLVRPDGEKNTTRVAT